MSNWYNEDSEQPKRYRALLRARYYDREGNVAILEEVAYVSAFNSYDAEIQFKVYPKSEPSQEDWDVSFIESMED